MNCRHCMSCCSLMKTSGKMHLTFILTVTVPLLIEIGKRGEPSSREGNRPPSDSHGYLPSPQASSGPLELPVLGSPALLRSQPSICYLNSQASSLQNPWVIIRWKIKQKAVSSRLAHCTVKTQHVSESESK